jgi:hypothetical protein
MPQTNPIDKISKNDVKPGDMLLYVLNEKPHFLPIKEGNTWENFCVLIDRLIIAMSGSLCTHSALAANENDTVIEATLPFCRYRKVIFSEGYSVLVRRVASDTKGAEVLNHIPEGIVPDVPPGENLPYAYAQSAIAALLCLFRREAPLDPAARDVALVFLQLILHPLAKEIDQYIAERQGKDGAWFCSQLVTYCYDQAAKTDSDFKLHFPALDSAKQSLFNWLVTQVPAETRVSLANPGSALSRGLRSSGDAAPNGDALRAGIAYLTVLEGQSPLSTGENPLLAAPVPLRINAEQILADAYHILAHLGIENFDEYKESLIMPSDLARETALRHIGTLYDAS